MSNYKCKGCGKEIYWGVTVEGKKIPLDIKAPVYYSWFEVHSSFGPQEIEVAKVNNEDGMDAEGQIRRFYVSHFATCPKANDFSASKKAKAQMELTV